MKKISKILAVLFLVALAAFCLVGCVSTLTVDFNVAGKMVITATANKQGKVYEPNIATSNGAYIEGWYTADGRENDIWGEKFDFDNDIVSRAMVLYAKVLNEKYSVTYDLGYTAADMPEAPKQTSVNLDGSFVIQTAPKRIGYEFLGWTDGESVYAPNSDYVVTDADNILLVAMWKYKVLSVRFIDDSGNVLKTQQVPYGGDATAPISATHTYSEVYEFAGWDKSTECITEDTDINAEYKYLASSDKYFDFTLNEDKSSYSISLSNEMPNFELLVLPKKHNGYPVTEIESEGFSFSGRISLFIPDSIKVINEKAFQNSRVIEVKIQSGIEKIEDYAFRYCYSLSSINIPSTLKSFGTDVFKECEKLSNIVVEEGCETLNFDIDTLYNGDKTKIFWVIPYLTQYTIQEGVKVIPAGLFANSKTIKSVTINANLELLPCSTFLGCRNLSTVTINGSIKKVAGVYENAEAETVTPDMIAMGYINANNYGAFMNCKGLTSISFPEGLEYIGPAAFSNCSSLKSINLPSTIKSIADDAFWLQSALGMLKTISINGNENDYFYVDENACLIRKGDAEKGDAVLIYANGSEIENYVIPDGVKEIMPAAFMRCSNLKGITIPEGVTIIPQSCFLYCTNLNTVNLPSTLKLIKSTYDGLYGAYLFNGYYGSFQYCKSLKNIDFDNTALETIEAQAFTNSGLTAVNIPASIKNIGEYAFGECPITVFAVDDNNKFYKDIDGVLFTADGNELISYPIGKTDVKEYTVPSGTLMIAEKAFFGHNLEKVIIAESVTTIRSEAFVSYEYDADYNLLWQKLVIEFMSFEAPSIEGNNSLNGSVVILVPDGAYKEYYLAFLSSGYENMIDDYNAKVLTYVLDTDSENSIDNIVAPCIANMPIPEKEGLYFQGWFTKSGENEDWGSEISFPYFYEGEGDTVTIYAKWAETKREDGSCEAFAFTLTTDFQTFELGNGTYYFTFDITMNGYYDLEVTSVLFDYLQSLKAYSESIGEIEFPYDCFLVEEGDSDKLTLVLTLDGLEQPMNFDLRIINLF